MTYICDINITTCIIDRRGNRTMYAPVDNDGILNLEGSSGLPMATTTLAKREFGNDFTCKREFVAPDNVAIKITEPLAGTPAIGSAAADEETVGAGAGAGPGGAGAVDNLKLLAHDRETNLKVNLVVLKIVSDWAATNLPLSGRPAGCN